MIKYATPALALVLLIVSIGIFMQVDPTLTGKYYGFSTENLSVNITTTQNTANVSIFSDNIHDFNLSFLNKSYTYFNTTLITKNISGLFPSTNYSLELAYDNTTRKVNFTTKSPPQINISHSYELKNESANVIYNVSPESSCTLLHKSESIFSNESGYHEFSLPLYRNMTIYEYSINCSGYLVNNSINYSWTEISDVRVNTTLNSATINWTTNNPSKAIIDFLNTSSNVSERNDFGVVLLNLTENSTYNISITNTDNITTDRIIETFRTDTNITYTNSTNNTANDTSDNTTNVSDVAPNNNTSETNITEVTPINMTYYYSSVDGNSVMIEWSSNKQVDTTLLVNGNRKYSDHGFHFFTNLDLEYEKKYDLKIILKDEDLEKSYKKSLTIGQKSVDEEPVERTATTTSVKKSSARTSQVTTMSEENDSPTESKDISESSDEPKTGQKSSDEESAKNEPSQNSTKNPDNEEPKQQPKKSTENRKSLYIFIAIMLFIPLLILGSTKLFYILQERTQSDSVKKNLQKVHKQIKKKKYKKAYSLFREFTSELEEYDERYAEEISQLNQSFYAYYLLRKIHQIYTTEGITPENQEKVKAWLFEIAEILKTIPVKKNRLNRTIFKKYENLLEKLS